MDAMNRARPRPAFDKAGERSYPEIELGDAVQVIGEVNEHGGKTQIESSSMIKLDAESTQQLHKLIDEALNRKAKPKDVDSIHVVIYKKDSIRHVLGDYVACRGCAESSIWVNLDNRYLKKEWGYGELFMEETAYCNGKKTVFPAVSFTLKQNAVAYIQVYNDLLSHDNYSSNDIYSPFIPIQNECGVDSLYKIGVYNSEYCEE